MELLRRIIIAHSKKDDFILDPFSGSGTTGIIADELDRKYAGIDIEKDYLNLSIKRFHSHHSNFFKPIL